MPTAIMAPEISPPGRCANKNSAPPAVPITRVSSTLRVLARVGMAKAIEAGIRLTPPYGKFAGRGQMRQRDAAMRVRPRPRAWPSRSATALPVTLPVATGEGDGKRQVFGLAAASFAAFLHSDMNF